MKSVFLIFSFCFLTSYFSNAQSLNATRWILTSIDDLEAGKSKMTNEKYKISLQFDSDTTYSGNGCNSYSGSYRAEDQNNFSMNTASIKGLENCLGLGNLEKETIVLYSKAKRYRIDDGKLFIFTSDEHRICFKKQ